MSTTHASPGSPPIPGSPIFDAPEFPTLRKTRPLPRRAHGLDIEAILDDVLEGVARGEVEGDGGGDPLDDPGYGVLPAVDLPLGSTRRIGGSAATNGHTSTTFELPLDELEGDEGEADGGYYSDRMQHGNNAKKRKVPAAGVGAVGAGPYRHRDAVEEEQAASHDHSVFPPQASVDGQTSNNSNSTTVRPLSKGKLSPATYAGIAHKEMLKTRKRQLAAVLGALSHGDTLALDQALSATYPVAGLIPMSFASSVAGDEVRMRMSFSASGNGEGPKTRLSKRAAPRGARVFKKGMLPRHPDSAPFPQCDFGFRSPSATSKRLVTTKEEVAALRKRFEAELTRQAAKAAKLAATHRLATARGARGTKRPERVKQRARAGTNTARGGDDRQAGFLEPAQGSRPGSAQQPTSPGRQQHTAIPPLHSPPPTSKPHGKKKKKRSALANASNPHHLRNYVPSRLPHSSPAAGSGAAGAGQLCGPFDLSPFPLRFLAADIPPRRGKRGNRNLAVPAETPGQPGGQSLTNPADEWICSMCEHELFYGDDAAFRRAVRNRKKILSRRRRALERARGGARKKGGGGGNVGAVGRGDDGESDEDDDEDRKSVV